MEGRPKPAVEGASTQPLEKLFITEKSGISGDYLNEFGLWMSYDLDTMDQSHEWVDWLMEDLASANVLKRGYILKTYQEHFPATKYANVVNERNGEGVALLDELVVQAQRRFDADIAPLVAKYEAGSLTEDDRKIIFDFIRYMVGEMSRARSIIGKST